MYKILVIEDDPVIREELAALLRADGYQVTEDLPCDLALLDINLPGENGFEICRRLRKHSDVPVIFLTAREAVEDEIVGFGVGADDYIPRLLKRNAEPVRTVRGLTLYLADLRVGYGEQTAELTKNEARILACLMKKDLCTRQEIVEDLWNNSCFIDENTLYVNINRLREKLAIPALVAP